MRSVFGLDFGAGTGGAGAAAAFLGAAFLGLAPDLKRKAVMLAGGLSWPPKSERYSSARWAASVNNARNRASMAWRACVRRLSPCSFHFWYSTMTSGMDPPL